MSRYEAAYRHICAWDHVIQQDRHTAQQQPFVTLQKACENTQRYSFTILNGMLFVLSSKWTCVSQVRVDVSSRHACQLTLHGQHRKVQQGQGAYMDGLASICCLVAPRACM